MAAVVWLPGVLGSTIGVRVGAWPIVRPIWVDVPTLLLGDIVSLQLAPDGVSPGPLAHGQAAVVTGPYLPAYGELAGWLIANGHDVLTLGYDWRFHPAAAAPAVAALIAGWARGRAVWLVGHSYGGVLTRAIAPQAAAGAPPWSVAGVITVGAPHYGSFESARLLAGLPPLYRGMERLCAPGARFVQGVGARWLWETVRTWPAWYALMPSRDVGPLATLQPDVARALYLPSTYAADSQPSPSWLAAAPGLQAALPGWPPGVPCYTVAGTGYPTSFGWHHLLGGPYDASNYITTQDGDGYVTLAQASLTGATVITVPVQHTYQPLDPRVWGVITGILAGH